MPSLLPVAWFEREKTTASLKREIGNDLPLSVPEKAGLPLGLPKSSKATQAIVTAWGCSFGAVVTLRGQVFFLRARRDKFGAYVLSHSDSALGICTSERNTIQLAPQHARLTR